MPRRRLSQNGRDTRPIRMSGPMSGGWKRSDRLGTSTDHRPALARANFASCRTVRSQTTANSCCCHFDADSPLKLVPKPKDSHRDHRVGCRLLLAHALWVWADKRVRILAVQRPPAGATIGRPSPDQTRSVPLVGRGSVLSYQRRQWRPAHELELINHTIAMTRRPQQRLGLQKRLEPR
jgi:hypothetical protein